MTADSLACLSRPHLTKYKDAWLLFGNLELQFYSIRHLQHHAGELCHRLGAVGIDVEWVDTQDEAL